MIRIGTMVFSLAIAGGFLLPASGAAAQTAPSGIHLAQALPDAPTARRVRRPATRLRVYPNPVYPADGIWPDDVYPRFNPGPNAVRECNATYVQEFRPSGTVIVPRMSCYWRRG
jgi:hypothetical protein